MSPVESLTIIMDNGHRRTYCMVTQTRATSPQGLPPAHKLDQAVIFMSHYSSFFSLTVTIRLKWNLWRNNRRVFSFFHILKLKIRGELL